MIQSLDTQLDQRIENEYFNPSTIQNFSESVPVHSGNKVFSPPLHVCSTTLINFLSS